jgi:ribonuclease BN (tRNA processing enzyme)
VKLTVVGCSPAWPNPGSAHSGYLVENNGGCLLLDCGPGVLGKLRERDGGWPRVDAIAITHWHLDHWGDLVPWVWGAKFGLGRDVAAPELWVPPGGGASLTAFGTRFGTEAMFEDIFRIREYGDEETVSTVAGLEFTPTSVPHYLIETFELRFSNGGRTLAYSGDSAPRDRLIESARGADLFLCEATLASGSDDGQPRGHLSADEAVATFEAAKASRLLLTHRPRELALEPDLEQVYEGFEVEL